MKKYTAHGLLFESEFDLQPLRPITTDKPADVLIHRGVVAKDGLVSPKISRKKVHVSDDIVWLKVPDVSYFQISKGNEIIVDPYHDADQQSLRLYLMGSCMGAILHQRGHLVLHANAICIKQTGVLFAGKSGAGKSTTAAMFHQKGFEVVSDDIVALNSDGIIMGGFPQIKLWQDALDGLNIPSENLNRIRLQADKYSFPIDENYNDRCLPIGAIYILEKSTIADSEHVEFQHLEGLQKFNSLLSHTYRRGLMEGLGLHQQHNQISTKLINSVHMKKIIRPVSGFDVENLTDYVINDLEAAGVI